MEAASGVIHNLSGNPLIVVTISAFCQDAVEDVTRVAGQHIFRLKPFHCRLGQFAPPGFEHPPGAESGHQPGCDLRVDRVDFSNFRADKVIALSARGIEAGHIGCGKHSNERANAIGITDRECRMLHQRLHPCRRPRAMRHGLHREPLVQHQGIATRCGMEVRQRLPERPARLFIVSADPQGFQAGRARYHLLPHNGYAGFSRVPHAGEARAGDYVLILSPLNGVGYNRSSQALEWQGGRLPAEMLYVAAAGALFRVRGG